MKIFPHWESLYWRFPIGAVKNEFSTAFVMHNNLGMMREPVCFEYFPIKDKNIKIFTTYCPVFYDSSKEFPHGAFKFLKTQTNEKVEFGNIR